MKRASKIFLLLLLFVAGALAHRYREYLINRQFVQDHFHFRKSLNAQHVLDSGRVMVFLAFGQSNSANFGDGTYVCRNPVYNFNEGKIYVAQEPLLGAEGTGCSVWTRLADKLIDSGYVDKVIIVPCGMGGTSVNCWAEGYCRDKLMKTLDDLESSGIQLTHIFWCQGETDNDQGTLEHDYQKGLEQVVGFVRERGIDAPFYIARTSYFPFNNDHPLGIDQGIRRAQNAVIQSGLGTREGPDTDALNLAYYRFDAVHFSARGLDVLAEKWFAEIVKNN